MGREGPPTTFWHRVAVSWGHRLSLCPTLGRQVGSLSSLVSQEEACLTSEVSPPDPSELILERMSWKEDMQDFPRMWRGVDGARSVTSLLPEALDPVPYHLAVNIGWCALEPPLPPPPQLGKSRWNASSLCFWSFLQTSLLVLKFTGRPSALKESLKWEILIFFS